MFAENFQYFALCIVQNLVTMHCEPVQILRIADSHHGVRKIVRLALKQQDMIYSCVPHQLQGVYQFSVIYDLHPPFALFLIATYKTEHNYD